jgi:N-acetylmuramoyl-L-alanine amidase
VKICIDAGHGLTNGRPTGAVGNGIIEDGWAYVFSKRLAHYLRKNKHSVVLSRPGFNNVDLDIRAKTAVGAQCELFLSIHLNAANSDDANGVEAFIVDNDQRSKTIAEKLVGVVANAGLKNRGVKPDEQSHVGKLAVLRNTYKKMPAVLLEVGFLTNKFDASKLTDPRWVENLACTIAKSI